MSKRLPENAVFFFYRSLAVLLSHEWPLTFYTETDIVSELSTEERSSSVSVCSVVDNLPLKTRYDILQKQGNGDRSNKVKI